MYFCFLSSKYQAAAVFLHEFVDQRRPVKYYNQEVVCAEKFAHRMRLALHCCNDSKPHKKQQQPALQKRREKKENGQAVGGRPLSPIKQQ